MVNLRDCLVLKSNHLSCDLVVLDIIDSCLQLSVEQILWYFQPIQICQSYLHFNFWNPINLLILTFLFKFDIKLVILLELMHRYISLVKLQNPWDVIQFSGNVRIHLDSFLSVFNIAGLPEEYHHNSMCSMIINHNPAIVFDHHNLINLLQVG